MGKRITTFDDTDEQLDADETVHFSFKGVDYEIDLHESNVDKFKADMQKWIDAGRRAGRATPVRSAAKKSANPELDVIRAWASKNGHRVANKGRIPDDVYDAFYAANPDATGAPAAPKADKPPAKVAGKTAAAKTTPAFSAANA